MRIVTTISLLMIGLFSIVVQNALAQDYDASKISDSLRKNAIAVVRLDSTVIEVKQDRFVKKTKFVVTVFDTLGDDYKLFYETYNSLIKVNKIKGTYYDSTGKFIAASKNIDVSDKSTFRFSSAFYSDERVKILKLENDEYPFTICFETETVYKSLFFLPLWRAQRSNELAVEKAVLRLIYAKDMSIRSKQYFFGNHQTNYEKKEEDDFIFQKWELKDISAKANEPYSRYEENRFPSVHLAADAVALDRYYGNVSSWDEFGKFISELNSGKDELPPSSIEKIKAMTDSISDPKQKIEVLYKHLQGTTRYLLNAEGILGWQTIAAAEVEKSGYGDCKGLSNYMKAMLKYAGIQSYTTLVYASNPNYKKMDRAFAANVFNHVIVCVPLKNDTVWLECTSPVAFAGYLNETTQGRDVLVVTEEGGKILTTPLSSKKQSFVSRNVSMNIELGKDAQTTNWITVYSGNLQNQLNRGLKMETAAEQKEGITKMLPYKAKKINDFNYSSTNHFNIEPQITETIQAEVAGLVNETGKRYLINIPLMRIVMPDVFTKTKRSDPIVLTDDYRYTYEYKIDIPDVSKMESIPDLLTINQPYATFTYSPKIQGNSFVLSILFELNRGEYPASSYDDYIKMSEKVALYTKEITLSILK